MSDAVLKLEGIEKRFGSVTAVDRVDLAVGAGEFFSLLGPSGSGKTTLLRIIAGLETPDRGRVVIAGRDVTLLPPYERGIGMVFQDFLLFPHKTVAENVAFPLKMQNVPVAERLEQLHWVLKLVRLDGLEGRYPHQLSGGQKQRVAIAGALALRPACLVLDEPTAMLDPSGRAEVLAVVRRLNRELDMAVVWITHFMEEAAVADRVMVMADGKVQMVGTPREVFSQADRLRALRLDVPPAVLAAERLRAEGVPVPETILTLDELVEALCQLYSRP